MEEPPWLPTPAFTYPFYGVTAPLPAILELTLAIGVAITSVAYRAAALTF